MVDQEVDGPGPGSTGVGRQRARKIAIVGAGPADFPALFPCPAGLPADRFEAEPRPGGMLVQTIPGYRLPRNPARESPHDRAHRRGDHDRHAAGRRHYACRLKADGYEAVFLGIGAQEPVSSAYRAKLARGVVDALAFLRQYNLRGSVPVGKEVDGGRRRQCRDRRGPNRDPAWRQKRDHVYRRTREEMPAYAEEIEEAKAEGVRAEAPHRAHRSRIGNGRTSSDSSCRPMTLGAFDRSGRRRAGDVEGDESRYACDQIIVRHRPARGKPRYFRRNRLH